MLHLVLVLFTIFVNQLICQRNNCEKTCRLDLVRSGSWRTRGRPTLRLKDCIATMSGLLIASRRMLCNASQTTQGRSSVCECLDDALRVRQLGGDYGSIPPGPVDALDRNLPWRQQLVL